MDRDNLKKIRKRLESYLPAKRYEHSLGVEYTAAALAMRYGSDIYKAELAGILHDCAKHFSDEELIRLCKNAGIETGEEALKAPQLLHAIYAPHMAREEFGIEDEEVLSALRWHTTGRPKMSLLESIIYVADYIEPGRKPLPMMKEIREWAFRDIDFCVYKIAENTIDYLREKGQYIDKMTFNCYDSLKERYGYGKEQKTGRENI